MINEYTDFLSMRGEAQMPIGPRDRWRLYYNKREAGTLVCSIDGGHPSTEFAVQRAMLRNVRFVTTSTPDQAKGERNIHDGPRGLEVPFCGPAPVFWIEFEAKLKMEYGVAYFDGYDDNELNDAAVMAQGHMR